MKIGGFGKTMKEQAMNVVPSFSKPAFRHRWGHYRLNAMSGTIVFAALIAAMIAMTAEISGGPSSADGMYLAAGALGSAIVLFALPFRIVSLLMVAALWAGPSALGISVPLSSGLITLAYLVAPGFEVVPQWDKAVILRLGRFHRVKGPGVVYLVPMVDTVAGYVDTRIRVTDFSAEMSLTLDTVPVNIDALAFWMIWDAEKAVLEVQDYEEAVVLSAQTALRSSIGANTLTDLLAERERMAREIQEMVDAKTNPWGITIISVEFKEILVPKELEDALSREAQAEREKKSRQILGAAEAEISAVYSKAAEVYKADPTALQLRAMNMIYESMRNKGGLVLTPASALETMNLGTVMGAAALGGASGAIPEVLPPEFNPLKQAQESAGKAESGDAAINEAQETSEGPDGQGEEK